MTPQVSVNEALDALPGSSRFSAVVFFWSFHIALTGILLRCLPITPRASLLLRLLATCSLLSCLLNFACSSLLRWAASAPVVRSLLAAIVIESFLRLRDDEDKASRGAPPKGVHTELMHLAREAAAALWAPFSKRVHVSERRIAQQLAEWAGGPRAVPLEAAPPRAKPRVLRVGDKVYLLLKFLL